MRMRPLFILAALASLSGLARAEEIVPGRVLVRWRDAAAAARRATAAATANAATAKSDWRVARALGPDTHLLTTTATEAATRALAARLARDPDVLWAEPDHVRRIFGAPVTPNDPRYKEQWALPLIKAPLAWSRSTGSSAVTVAIIDTGSVPHPEIMPRIVGGYDFITDPMAAGDGDGRDADFTDNGTAGPDSSELHGTHVAGIIGGVANNGVGIAGLDWACQLLVVRTLGINRGTGVDSDIADAIRWSAGIHVDGVPDNPFPAAVINMSFGGDGASQVMQDAVTEAVARGSIVVAAAGNASVDASNTVPAALDGVIAVGAVDQMGVLAAYSNYGPTVALMAPGGNPNNDPNTGAPLGVLSTIEEPTNDFTYTWLAGTSQATPFVSGALSLMKGVYPGMSSTGARKLLTASADPASQCRSPADATKQGCGAGLLDVDAALVLAGEAQASGGLPGSGPPPGTVIVGGCSFGAGAGARGGMRPLALVALVLAAMVASARRRRSRTSSPSTPR
jgi:serine protease